MDPLSRLAERLWWFTTGGDPGPLLEDAAIDESQAVLEVALRAGPDGQAEVLDRDAVAFAALVHWFRYTALPKGQCEGDYLRSVSLARAIGFDDPGQITVGLKVGGEDRASLDTVDAAVQWARHLAARFDQSSDQEELASAAGYLRARISVLPDPRLLDAFVAVVYRQFLARPDQLWLLEESVAAARRALGLTTEDDPLRDGRIYALGAVLDARTRISPPAEAVELLRGLASRTPDDDPALPSYLLALGRALPDSDETFAVLDRAMRVSAEPGLELLLRYVEVLPSHAPMKVLGVRRAIVDRMPADHPDRPLHLLALADVLRISGHHDEAIALLRSADVEGPWRARTLSVLSSALGVRFEHRGDLADLDDAVSFAREAEGLGDDLTAQAALGLALLRRYEHQRGRTDLTEALRHLREVTARAPDDHPGRPAWLSNLGAALSFHGPDGAEEAVDTHRAALSGALDHGEGLALALVRRGKSGDLDEAVGILREAVEATPDGQPRKAVRLCNLGEALRVTAERRNDPALLNEAVRVQREALNQCAADAPERAWVLGSLASTLLDRFTHTHHPRDRGDAVTALHAAVEHLPAPVSERIGAAVRLGGLGAETGDAEAAAAGFGGVVDLLPGLVANGIARADREELLGAWQSRGNDAAAWAVAAGRPERALDLVERSRLLLSGGQDVSVDVGERTVVVINVSRYRCDALLVSAAGVCAIPLPGLTFADVTARAHVFLGAQARLETSRLPLPEKVTLLEQVRETLDWLWRTAVLPVLDALDPVPPRIWWSPTGLLSVLPLHAAGAFAGESVLDRVVSSYAGSLRMFARSGDERPVRPVLVVAVPEAEGLPALHGVDEEVCAIERIVTPTVLRGSEATLEAVTAALAEHDVAHFACHATQNLADPAESGIVLHDGKLGLAAIAAVPGGAQLAFLSACRTGVGAVDLPDEALHVAAGFQAAGFRHVVGTLWSVEDQSAAEFTAAVYARLRDGSGLDPARTAVAVHEATLLAREEDRFDPMRWAQWFHLGP
ncbi:CHAT domain-containing tetratricopeptide repeat protein [Lentzea sp. BCCO 10_0061]|uniref:CHAT domain-containing tetratricopeptide repeat protein n=1 Tax=Lentzea sokolovensis TaxID=3095429 RepID=A0ABU4UTH2_9PSEU|nr:CHAT domain-containing tetratricopeptide repeat protein [Lentzea sp. BCCO 10_0061]MDX8142309.1 CHAT domain-containing tetratricopeptide repeat protein [Lentzea sp. BCCO 10_0061]